MVNYKKYYDLEVFEGKISKHQYPWHFHDCYTLIVVTEGSISYEFQEKSLNVDDGQALIIEPFLIHRNTINQTTTYKALFLPTFYFELINQNRIHTQLLSQPKVVEGTMDLIQKIEQNENKTELNDSIYSLLELINHLQVKQGDVSHSASKSIPKIDYNSTINELSEKAHLSKFHFQRKFKKYNGLTIGQLKQQEKTIKAKFLLENGKQSTDVAYELGFFDQSHFIKYFKKMWATTPKSFK